MPLNPPQIIRRSLTTHAPAANLLIRFMVGGIFFFEGIQKFFYPADLGSGRFAKIGIPAPEFFGPFVGFAEIACGTAASHRSLHPHRRRAACLHHARRPFHR